MSNTFIILLITLTLVALVALAALAGKVRQPRIIAKALLTENEIRFWRLLRVAADPLHVAPQVAMGALLKVGQGDKREQTGARNRFAQKVIDFVLLDDAGKVVLLIELDDRTHNPAKDKARDQMTSQAGYKMLRVQGVAARDVHLLKAAIDEKLGIEPSWTPPVFNPANAPRRPRGTSGHPSSPPA